MAKSGMAALLALWRNSVIFTFRQSVNKRVHFSDFLALLEYFCLVFI